MALSPSGAGIVIEGWPSSSPFAPELGVGIGKWFTTDPFAGRIRFELKAFPIELAPE